ncbi:hypothetical protein HK102_009921 [Quaeritorhiza haematococci]|nr:hypothetical protein HK102_009921 [Quaeritorhiza haematococci]
MSSSHAKTTQAAPSASTAKSNTSSQDAPPETLSDRLQKQAMEHENLMLSALKTSAGRLTSVEAGLYPELQGAVPRGSAASKAQSAFGKYASAVALERGETPQQVMQETQPLPDVNDADLAAELRVEALQRAWEEKSLNAGVIERGGPTARVQSAASKMAEAVIQEQEELGEQLG